MSQTVGLNTPGEQDGLFILEVNGVRTIERHDIFYRPNPESKDDGDGHGGLLGGLIGRRGEDEGEGEGMDQVEVARRKSGDGAELITHLGIFFRCAKNRVKF